MNGRFLKRTGAVLLAALMLFGVAFIAPSNVEAQHRRRVIIVRPVRPFGWRHGWWGYNRWDYDPWSPYGSYYRQYVFDNSEDAVDRGYNDGFKTGKDDGKKAKSYKPERSHYFHDSGFGNYAEVYRSGFSRGYRDGYKVGADQRAG
jgi:hypothetical protein